MSREFYFIIGLFVVLIGITLLIWRNPLGWADGFVIDLGLLGKTARTVQE